MSRALSLPAALLFLAGCTSAAPRDISLSPGAGVGVITFGLAPERPALTMNVAAIDPRTCRILGGFKRYSADAFPFKPNVRRFMVDDYKPGFYVVTSVLDSARTIQFNHSLMQESVAFEVRPGKIGYLGDFQLTPFRPKLLGFDEAALREHLAGFPRLTGQIERVALVKTAFDYKEQGPRVPGCNLQPTN